MASESASGIPPDDREFIPDEFDQIRWGTDKPESPLVDQAGIPKLPPTSEGDAYIHAAHDAAQRHWHPTREASEFDPSRQGVPQRHFRRTMTPVSDPGTINVIGNPRPRRPS